MRLQSMSVANFKSFIGQHSFNFSNKTSGLYYLSGKNLLEPEMGANGAGKSNLLDAVYWCFYGRSLRGLRGKDVHSWRATNKNTIVEVVGVVKGEEIKIQRSWNPNHVKLWGAGQWSDVEQDKIDDVLNLNANAFEFAVMVGQTSSMFLDLKPTPKLNLFSTILNLDFWIEKSVFASAKFNTAVERLNEIREQSTYDNRRLKEMRGEVSSLKFISKKFEDERAEEIKKHKAIIKQAIAQRQEDVEEAEQLERKLKKLNKKIENKERNIPKLQASLRKREQRFAEAERAVADTLVEIRLQKEALEKFKQLGAVCPVCEQEIDEKHKATETNAILEKISDLKARAKKQGQRAEALRDRADDLGMRLRSRQNITTKLKESRYPLSAHLGSRKTAIQTNTGYIAQTKTLLKKAEEKENTLETMIAALTKKRKHIKIKLAELKEKASILKKRIDGYSFWIKGFKQIRLQMLEDFLLQFEIETNNTLKQLGLPGWTVKYDVERENSSGGVSKGFSVFVNSPHTKKPVRWEAWSGGENQRIRLAASMALMNLMYDQLGLDFNIEVWDEPTKALSPEGIACLLDVLAQRAEAVDKQIWIVEQHSLDYGGFKGIINVKRNKKGSRIVETIY